ncbi:hypothetical protein GCM10022631_02040 [Deinococcus rubellus]|uniref:Uncharacterized protein n=1 Tax=Deinococcus rubellus TaxID=1889240 RepID=A0ABY5YI65_9DEIO|nr:hypothetical protein [Deinococcus rubellus]UWX64787.1 hypothetical protein N0D28_03750 [Deinococcus rubellus]
MSSIYASPPAEVLRLESDPYAEMHQPDRPFRIALFAPEMNVLDEDVSRAVINLSRAELFKLHVISGELLTNSAEEAGERG